MATTHRRLKLKWNRETANYNVRKCKVSNEEVCHCVHLFARENDPNHEKITENGEKTDCAISDGENNQ